MNLPASGAPDGGPTELPDPGTLPPPSRANPLRGDAEAWRTRLGSLAILAGEAASLAFMAQQLHGSAWVGGFIARNLLGHDARSQLILSLGGAATLAMILGVIYVVWLKTEAAWTRLALFGRALAPVGILWALPALTSTQAYDGHPLDLLLASALLVMMTEGLARVALAAGSAIRRPIPRAATMSDPTSTEAPARVRTRAADLTTALAITAYVVVSSLFSLRLHDKLLTSNYDLGLFENLFYNTLHGRHGWAMAFRYFAIHAELILYPILPLYALFPSSKTLLILQSVLLGGAAVPLYLLARRWLRDAWQALALVVCYLLYPAVHGPNFYDFHFLTLSVFFILWAAYFLTRRRPWLFSLFIFGALLCREDVALGLGAIGVGLWLINRHRRVGATLALVGSVWFVLMKFVWMRQFGGLSFADYYADLVPPGEHGFEGVLRTLLSNPLFVFATVASREKLVLALHLLVPLAFLPLRQRRTLFLFLPGFLVLGLSTNRSAILQISFQYVCHFVPYLFIGAAAALAVRPRHQRWAPLAAGIVGAIITSTHFGIFRPDHIEAGFQTMSVAFGETERQHLADLDALLTLIPEGASVATGEHEGPHAARRRDLYTVKDGTSHADYLLFGLRSLRWGGREAILEAMASGEYGVVERRGNHVLLKRGAPTGLNADVAAWLRNADPNHPD